MKKIIYVLLILFVFMFFLNNSKGYIIPDESIRFRIIANSDSDIDQKTKLLVKKDLEKNIFKLVENSKSIEETRQIINDNESIIKDTIDKYNLTYDIKYGDNYFPSKEYKGITYDAGNYESLVITLGEGAGKNWWCVMYPPLCLLESKGDNYTDVEYKSYFKEILDKLTS